ncbi:MAG TPA: ATP-binding protein [Paucimonas sp.]|nr:ATP-binding protein [Paucimonas sp.]
MRARTYLILMVAAILLPAVGLCWLGLDRLLVWERDSRLRSVQETARSTALMIDREIAKAQAMLRVVANSQDIRDDDFSRLHKLLGTINSTPQSWFVVSDEHGQALLNTFVPYGTKLPERRGSWAARIVDLQKPRVSNYFVGTLARRPAISIDFPTPPATGKRYIVSKVFDASYYARILDPKAWGVNWIVTVFGSDGVAIACNKDASQFVGAPVKRELLHASQQRPAGVLRHAMAESADVYDVYMRSELSGWTVAIGVPAEEIEAPARQAMLFAASSLLAILGVSLGVAAFLARRLSSALHEATAVAGKLGQGDGGAAASRSNVHEIDTLLGALHEIHKSLAEETISRRSLEAEREGLLLSEQQARKLAEAQNAAKDDFLAMLGHELRNPLAAVSGAMAAMDMPGTSAETAARARRIAIRQVRHLTRIVDDLLEVRRIMTGKVVLHREPLNLRDMLEQCCEAQAVADFNVHDWSFDLQDAWVDADKTRLEQILSNVLGNAAKFTPPGGRITVTARRDGDQAVVSVLDTGIGITPELHERIFDIFVQGPTDIARSRGGLGLGLALVQELTKMHGGSVGVRSDGPGRGSEFVLRFPAIAAPAGNRLADETPQPPTGGRHILIVEDNEDGREMLATMLQIQGFKVSTAGGGEVALAKAESERPDIALIDIGLPDISGYDVARRLRSQPATRHIRLIALSGYGLQQDRDKSSTAGFDMHLTKPYTVSSLLAVL